VVSVALLVALVATRVESHERGVADKSEMVPV
jgi:hypothetical protein